MRKHPQDLAFPLGLGSKKQMNGDHQNGILNVGKILPGSSSANSDDMSPRAPLSDLDTINL
jgi:hypothetical protein